jgi:hypothetical protein
MSEAIELGERNPEPPTAAKRKQSCYAKWGRTPLFLYFIYIPSVFIL